ncbi:MAG TPA: hypothetical protein VGK73_03890 [Polyangiaceae bacterium]
MASRRPRRFAQGTSVDVGKTRVEIERVLVQHSATQYIVGNDVTKRSGFVHFALGGRQYRIVLPPRESAKRNEEQVMREQWRSMLLLLKAKLEIVASGMVTMEQEFLAYIVLPDGSRVGDVIEPKLQQAYKTGSMPALLPEWKETKS